MPNVTPRPVRCLAIAVSLLAVQRAAIAQCQLNWVPGRTPGTNGRVNASQWWDPDGAGPAAPLWIVAGQFQIAGNQTARNIAAYDPATGAWSALGAGLTTPASSLAVAANGTLIAGVGFGSAGGSLMRWNGSTWSAFAPGLMPISSQPLASGFVATLGVLPNGDVVAAGAMRVPGVPGAEHIALWNGTAWSALGSGSAEIVNALTVLSNGDVVAGIATAAGASHSVERWNGTSWSSLSGAGVRVTINALRELPSGDLLAGGQFSALGGVAAANIARWNGSAWSPLGAGVNLDVNAIEVLASGDVAVGGTFWTAGGVAANKVARWDGVRWSRFGAGLGNANSVADLVRTLVELPNGNLAAGGTFNTTGGTALSNVAVWSGTAWSPVGAGFVVQRDARVLATAVAPNGDVIAGGAFAGGSIVRWNGSSWSGLGAGFELDLLNPPVNAVAVTPNGDVIAAGRFVSAGGVPANNIARWNGMTWSPLGAGLPPRVTSLLPLPNGDLLAGGDFGYIARWSGTVWSNLGSGFNGTVAALALLPNGHVIAGGYFSGGVRIYDGTTWSPVGAGVGTGVSAVAVMPNGDLVVGGGFTAAGGVPASRVARWNGSTWAPVGAGTNFDVLGLEALPNGDLVAVGLFTAAGGVTANGIARWNGATWSTFGAGFGQGYGACVRWHHDGELVVGGSFTTVAGSLSPYLARLATSCPAAAVARGSGCPSSGGNSTLTADSLPWIGSTFVATGAGLPPTAVVVGVIGITPIAQGVAPLSRVFPQAGRGCDQLASLESLGLLVTTTGTAQSSVPLPNAPSLIGATLHHQMVSFEFDALGTLLSVTATNALQITLGAF